MLKVSIITVCFNAGKTIADTINSIVEQSYPNIEIIVIDGNSTDDTQQIVQSFGNKVHVFVSEPDLGIYDAMNKGMAKASGDVIGILNADDVLANKTVIQEIVAGFLDENVDCVYGDLVYVEANNLSKVVRYWKAGIGNPNKFLLGWMPPHPTFYIRKTVIEQCGAYDIAFTIASDYEFMLRLIVKYHQKLKYVPKVLVKMRVGGISNNSIHSRKKSFVENKNSWKKNGLNPYFFTIYFKIARKFIQYIHKPKA